MEVLLDMPRRNINARKVHRGSSIRAKRFGDAFLRPDVYVVRNIDGHNHERRRPRHDLSADTTRRDSAA
jgi:hypothetical protein